MTGASKRIGGSGDETKDIEAARKIGIKVISVSWGYNSSQALAAEHPDFLIYRPEELLQVLERKELGVKS
jgi:phosphoglycolate phosphatase-like HAD superfamily hydrolase